MSSSKALVLPGPSPHLQIGTKEFFSSLPFWKDLSPTEHKTVQAETRGLIKAHASQVTSRTEFVQHLANLQAVLEGKGFFVAFLQSLNIGYRSSYRYLEAYREVLKQIPEHVVKAAAMRGLDLVGYQASRPFGDYTEAIKALPPPKDPAKVDEWVDKIEAARKEAPRAPRKPRTVHSDLALKLAYRGVALQFSKLPPGKAKVTWSRTLLSILMTKFGLPAQTIEPSGIPAGFEAVVGRPKTNQGGSDGA